MTKKESADYDGLTLNDKGKEERGEKKEDFDEGYTGVRIHTLRWKEMSWTKKILGLAGCLLFLAFAWFFLLWGLALAVIVGALAAFRNLFVGR